MGYVVLHLDKSPGNEAPMTAHIARTVIPANCDPALTHLNKELMDYPDGISDRTKAIQHRLDTAGLTRKIGKNQVQVVRVMLTGSQEDMKRIESEGKLDEWCADNMKWLRDTFGKENIVSASLHLDETTPHIHATMIPIVTGERRKAKVEQEKSAGKKKYRKKSIDAVRLCVDDVMSRTKLKEYQDTYAEAMAKYGLQRGVDGSEARHVSTSEWYRELFVKNESLKEDIGQLLEQQAQAKQELGKVKSDVSKERLKNSAADVGASIMDGMGSLLGSSKAKRLQSEVEELKSENTGLKENLGNEINQLKSHIRTTETEHKSAIGKLSEQLEKAFDYFPHIQNLLSWEKFLKNIGLPKDVIKRLFNREEVIGSGELYSTEHSKKFRIESATIKLKQDPHQPSKISLTINGTDIFSWFKQKQQEFLKSIGVNIQPKQNKEQKKGRGI